MLFFFPPTFAASAQTCRCTCITVYLDALLPSHERERVTNVKQVNECNVEQNRKGNEEFTVKEETCLFFPTMLSSC